MKQSSTNWIFSVLVLGLFLAITLSGCGLFDRKPDSVALPQPQEAKAVPLPDHAPQRELGSLFSETSKWNDFYSAPTGRNVGDLVVLKPSEVFKSALNNQAGKGAQLETALTENARIVALVKEVLPRQVYRFEARQPLRVGKMEYFVTYKGKIRDQDIAADDTGTTDAVFDGQLQVDSKTVDGASGPIAASTAQPVADSTVATAKKKDGETESEKN